MVIFIDREISGLGINVNTINTKTDLPVCTTIQDIQEVTAQNAHIQDLKIYITYGWPHKKDDMAQDIQKYWPIIHEFAMIDGATVKGKTNNNTFSIADADIESAAQQPHGNLEDEAACM